MSSRSVNRPARSEVCPCYGGNLARLVHPVVMMILTKGPLHGYRIVQEAARTPVLAGERPDRTGVYRVLRSLEEGGYVVSSWDLSKSGPARKSYRLTPEGRECLAHWIETLEDYHRAIRKLLSDARKAWAEGESGRQGSE
jgi:PadR family transcriptional regulator, regulatory protein PadR